MRQPGNQRLPVRNAYSEDDSAASWDKVAQWVEVAASVRKADCPALSYLRERDICYKRKHVVQGRGLLGSFPSEGSGLALSSSDTGDMSDCQSIYLKKFFFYLFSFREGGGRKRRGKTSM